MSPLLSRVLVLVTLLVVPLALAVASQALASRPGPPEVEREPVRLNQDPQRAPASSPAGTPTAPTTRPPDSADPSPSGPRRVDPVVPQRSPDDDDDDDDDD